MPENGHVCHNTAEEKCDGASMIYRVTGEVNNRGTQIPEFVLLLEVGPTVASAGRSMASTHVVLKLSDMHAFLLGEVLIWRINSAKIIHALAVPSVKKIVDAPLSFKFQTRLQSRILLKSHKQKNIQAVERCVEIQQPKYRQRVRKP
jgi:hypothetical protein